MKTYRPLQASACAGYIQRKLSDKTLLLHTNFNIHSKIVLLETLNTQDSIGDERYFTTCYLITTLRLAKVEYKAQAI